MPKLNQIIAVANGKKSQTQKALTEIHHKLQKKGIIDGLTRTYQPKDTEDGDKLPPEGTRVQYTVKQALAGVQAVLGDLFNVIGCQDITNQAAAADVVVDGKSIIQNCPVTHLLFLEKQLVDLHTLIEGLPTLDPSEEWSFNQTADCYATPMQQTVRTKKIPKSFIAHPPTKEHPAQVQVYNEDVVVGYWSQIKFSGAIPVSERNALLQRVRKLQDAVKFAREHGNGIETLKLDTGDAVFGYLFNGTVQAQSQA